MTAHRFNTTTTVPGMEMKGESWFDDKGVLLKSVLTAAFGKVETTLVERKDQ